MVESGNLAIERETAALQRAYRAGDGENCGALHHNLSVQQEQAGVLPSTYLAHRLAGGILFFQAGSSWLPDSLGDLAMTFLEFWPSPPFPSSFDQLCRSVEVLEGIRFRVLVESLAEEGGAGGEEAFHAVLGMARRIAQEMGGK
jgi:hypothetical protein